MRYDPSDLNGPSLDRRSNPFLDKVLELDRIVDRLRNLFLVDRVRRRMGDGIEPV
jgi:hypothetical protein